MVGGRARGDQWEVVKLRDRLARGGAICGGEMASPELVVGGGDGEGGQWCRGVETTN